MSNMKLHWDGEFFGIRYIEALDIGIVDSGKHGVNSKA